jgi:hypothetical protein
MMKPDGKPFTVLDIDQRAPLRKLSDCFRIHGLRRAVANKVCIRIEINAFHRLLGFIGPGNSRTALTERV